MVATLFETLLKEFEPYFRCPLKPDENESCLIHLGMGFDVQIELNRYGLVLIGCKLGVLPHSRYRDLIFKQALKINGTTPPSTGIFGYSQKSSQLILFLILDPQTLNPDRITAILNPFFIKANLWAQAIKQATVPLAKETAPASGPAALFGLKR